MLSKKDNAILEFALQMVKEAEQVVEKCGDAYKALNQFDSKNSILFNLMQIGEKLQKIESDSLREILPIKETYSIRNRISHDYDGIDLMIVEEILVQELPNLKITINNILSGLF